jgi:hypothetical protein
MTRMMRPCLLCALVTGGALLLLAGCRNGGTDVLRATALAAGRADTSLLFVANYGNDTVTGYAKPYTSTPITISNGVDGPVALAAPGDLFVANYKNNTVTVYAKGNYTGAPLTISKGIDAPVALAVDSFGDLFVANQGNSTVAEYLNGYYARTPITISRGIAHPTAITVDQFGDLFVANGVNARYGSSVAEYAKPALTGKPVAVWRVESPLTLAVDSSGDFFVAPSDPELGGKPIEFDRLQNGQMREVPIYTVAEGTWNASVLTVDPSGNLFVIDFSGIVTEYRKKGRRLRCDVSDCYYVLPETSISDGLQSPVALALDSSGDLFVANNPRCPRPTTGCQSDESSQHVTYVLGDTVAEYAQGNYHRVPTIISTGISEPSALALYNP